VLPPALESHRALSLSFRGASTVVGLARPSSQKGGMVRRSAGCPCGYARHLLLIE